MNEEYFISTITTNLIRILLMLVVAYFADQTRRATKQINESKQELQKLTTKVNYIGKRVKSWSPNMLDIDSSNFSERFVGNFSLHDIDLTKMQTNGVSGEQLVKQAAKEAYKIAHKQCMLELKHVRNKEEDTS